MLNVTTFGESPSITVLVTEADGVLDDRHEVRVNWGTCGALPIREAEGFLSSFIQAVNFARKEAKRLKL